MKKVTIIINEEPSGIHSWNALRLASGMLEVNIEIRSALSAVPKVKKVEPLT